MKKNFQLIFAISLVICLFSFSGCDKTKDYLVRNDGLWNMTSINERIYQDGELLSDEDSTTGLGSVLFNENGTGSYRDADGNQVGSEFTWTYDDFGLDITQDGESIITTVLESSRKAQRWVTVIEEDLLGYIYRTETTTQLELAD